MPIFGVMRILCSVLLESIVLVHPLALQTTTVYAFGRSSRSLVQISNIHDIVINEVILDVSKIIFDSIRIFLIKIYFTVASYLRSKYSHQRRIVCKNACDSNYGKTKYYIRNTEMYIIIILIQLTRPRLDMLETIYIEIQHILKAQATDADPTVLTRTS